MSTHRSPRGLYWSDPDAWAKTFWAKTNRSSGQGPRGDCWIWTAGLGRKGYGQAWLGGKGRGAHRVAWELANGVQIPDGMLVCHTCDVPACVNPAHLFLGTHTDNMRDMYRKGRGPTGDRSGSRKHPERVPRGDRHGARLHPESLLRGDRHWTKHKPDRLAKGERVNTAKLTPDDVLEIFRLRESGLTTYEIAERVAVGRPHVCTILRKESWKHLHDEDARAEDAQAQGES